ncbi:chaperonin containing TCP1, group II (cytosolic) [Monocercomonoides exilis]|uniref:chaperonin containing TCP1, group II (cytosolic) n=1 Tax=Monocercomonoides exilis TaxID=2049356 RepID=UPI00355A8494|nr:chaperonin containing TCP1, group II (cytosolic) [Monocercomonoides exilis]|eukprot:MONOS_12885.1-p1 / transcript=MONOS_12885.1 / gene=MONOS_12885 / organism=Monocercomonoides_exilis_PA203 / gene_product=chaperonin containing TCP1, group II (cytosolic) / transcript_product=chaperonin containing TCP1, group II (cytosolic) / location=Mono_scaffold00746:12282-14191(+) / protein_length=542 / sequence_SO=supercontig / SO=protein_coding / is_pseudo=false
MAKIPMLIDETGQPFIILKDQTSSERVTGIDALKNNIFSAMALGQTIRTSYGPRGMDKALISKDGDVTITNDGRTILESMDIDNEIARLIVELSMAHDDEVGDGTTGVAILACSLLEQASHLLDKGIHPIRIAEGYASAAEEACKYLETIADTIEFDKDHIEPLLKPAQSCISSKIINRQSMQMASIAVDAVCSVCDWSRKDVHFDHIKIESKPGGRLEDTQLVHGIIIDKGISHPQMSKVIENAKIAILTCPFECPKPKTTYHLEIDTKEKYERLAQEEKEYYRKMVELCKNSGANLIICQWGFDDEANYLLMKNELPAIRWVGGPDIELVAMATGAKIIPRFEDITPDKLGRAGVVREMKLGGTTGDGEMTCIEGCPSTKTVTIFIRGSNKMMIEETKRSIHDAVCVTRNLIRDHRIIYGGGAAEIAMSLHVQEVADREKSQMQYAMRAFADALESIPIALADNSGLDAMAEVGRVKAMQVKEKNPFLGIDCLETGSCDMKKNNVFETMIGKKQQILLATQVVRMILKIDDLIKEGSSQ